MEPILWCIKYRPKQWDDFTGQDAAITQLRNLAASGTITNMIFYGPSGTGKSAAAGVFSREALGFDFTANYKMLNIRDVWDIPATKAKRKISDIAKIEHDKRTELDEYMSVVYREAKAHQKQLGRNREPSRTQLVQGAITLFASTVSITDNQVKILVLDEADALSHGMQQALRRTMELYSDVCRFILITPTLSGWSPAILSRCNLIRFPNVTHESVERVICDIAAKEGVELEEKAITAIAKESSGDLRRAINLLQVSSAASGAVTEDSVYKHSETHLTASTRAVVSNAIKGNYSLARKDLRNLLTLDGYPPQDVCQEIGRDLIKRPLDPHLLSDLLTRVAEIDYRMTQSKNQFIQLDALLASIWAMTSAKAKS